MKNLWLHLILLQLMSTYSYCQTIYPKKIIFQGDTCVAISIDQTIALNLKLNRKSFLEKQYALMIDQDKEYLKIIHDLSKQVNERDSLIASYEKYVNNVSDSILLKERKNKELEKKIHNKKRLEAIMLGIIGTLAAALILGG